MKNKILLWSLAVVFAVLMSLPFLLPHCGFVALFGIVPLLCMERIASLNEVRRVWIYHYSAFVIWNAITTFWVCNATVGGGIFAVLANSFQMSVVFGLFRLGKKHFKGVLPYLFLMFTWIAWERAYFDADISWPWLVLGNAFARSIQSVQWYEFTGALGGSLWIWLSNLSIFGLMVALSDGTWAFRFNSKAKFASVLGLILLLGAPFAVSKVIYNNYHEKSDPVDVLVFQPNIDPYNKFRAMTQMQQDEILISQMKSALDKRRDRLAAASTDTVISFKPVLLLAPETFTNNIRTGHYEDNPTWRRMVAFLSDYPEADLLLGASTYSIFSSDTRPSYTARQLNDGRWYESHNSALMLDGDGRTEIFHKSKLVVAVEKTPYPAIFCRIDDWLGGVMGRCVGQDEISLLHHDGMAVGCAVCYESIYGEYYTDYIRKGAEIMTIITNDAWWGDTPGYKQHLTYASLRAIETRRSIARCANTGISAFIDQRGVIHEPSPWWQPAVLEGQINKNDEMTFFVTYGDIAGRVSTFLFCLLFLALLVSIIRHRSGTQK